MDCSVVPLGNRSALVVKIISALKPTNVVGVPFRGLRG
jgi:hypothetical protein